MATLMITGVTSQEEVEWKLPSLPLEKATLSTKEVVFSRGEEKVSAFFWGDLIGIRYKVLELRPIFHWIGFKNGIEFEALCNDYLELAQKSKYPVKTVSLKKESDFFFRRWWKQLFYDSSSNFFLKKAALKVEYFPLTETPSSHIIDIAKL